MVRPDGPAAASNPVAVRTIAPEPLVPDVSTPENSTMLQAMDFWDLDPKSMVTGPAVGDAPIARNSEMRLPTAAAMMTQVRPFPESVGIPGVGVAVLATHARTSWFAPGAIDCVVALLGFPLAPPAVSSVALTAARAADGTTNDRTARLAAWSVLMNVFIRAPRVGNSAQVGSLAPAGVDAPLPGADPAHRLIIPRRCTHGSGH